MRKPHAGELNHGRVDGMKLRRNIRGGRRPVGIQDVSAAQHVELREISCRHLVRNRRFAARKTVPQKIAVARVRVRATEHGRRLKLDQIGKPLAPDTLPAA
jgi:hypothetical protein